MILLMVAEKFEPILDILTVYTHPFARKIPIIILKYVYHGKIKE